MRFVLIHGGFHGAWCWSRTIPELERLGHEAIAIDRPGSGERITEERSHASATEAIVSVMQSGDVLVGHSGGCHYITLAANAAPELVGHLVYLAGSLAPEGGTIIDALQLPEGDRSPDEAIDAVTGMGKYMRLRSDGQMEWANVEGVKELFYHDCDEETARWAFEHLDPPPSKEFPDPSRTTPMFVPRFWEADLPRSFIVCLQDHAMPRWLADMVADRLGVEPLTIDTSHSPFLSRPAEFAELLVYATTTVPIGPLKPG